MIEYVIIPAPHSFPYTCVVCSGQKGPMLDPHREIPAFGHVFVCEGCAKTAARMFGFAPGEKLDELALAADAVNERDREIVSLNKQVNARTKERNDLRRELGTVKSELADTHARVVQLEAKMAEQAKFALALVGEEG